MFLGVLAMDSFRASNRITMLHPTSFVSNTSISYWMRQSDDGGATWGEPIPVGNDSTTGGSCGVQYGATDSDPG
ncbi:MAG: hypothetical protein IPJ04_10135 [Candidatus Eisenbacteria bacterium]|nr:hypothetical protein [Candidatus Eisenbacteria bacterium]